MIRIAYAIAGDRPGLVTPSGTSRLTLDGLSVVHGPAPADSASPGIETLTAYAATIEALHAAEPVLPLRFGSLHVDEASLATLVKSRPGEWRGLLDVVEGCDEMGLRILLSGEVAEKEVPPPTESSPGLTYLAARRVELAAKDAEAAETARVEAAITESLSGFCRRWVVERPGPGRERLLSMAFLVPRPGLAAFREAARSLGLDPALGRVLPSGPWPPYHFASPTETL